MLALSTLLAPCLARAARDYSAHEGYLSTTDGERDARYQDVVMMRPPGETGPSLRDRIFTDELNKEFRDRYDERFGRTEMDRVYNSPNRFTFYNDIFGFRGTPQAMNDEHRRFGELVMRRLAEFHVDNWAKSDPKARAVWEAKERISQVKLEVQSFRFDVRYSLAGNAVDVLMVNPYFNVSRIRMEIDNRETILTLGRTITASTSVESAYKVTDGIFQFVVRRSLTPALGASVSTSTFTRDAGPSIRESVYLAGMSYGF